MKLYYDNHAALNTVSRELNIWRLIVIFLERSCCPRSYYRVCQC